MIPPFINFQVNFFKAPFSNMLVLISPIWLQNVRHLINESDKVSSVPTKEECYCHRFIIRRILWWQNISIISSRVECVGKGIVLQKNHRTLRTFFTTRESSFHIPLILFYTIYFPNESYFIIFFLSFTTTQNRICERHTLERGKNCLT